MEFAPEMLTTQVGIKRALERQRTASKGRVPRELEIALHAPIGPHRISDDTIVIDQDGWYRTMTPSSVWPGANEVLFSNLDEGDPDSQVRRIVSEYHERGLPVSWCVYPWTRPANLGARFVKMGAAASRIRAFLCDTDHPLEEVHGVDVRRVASNSDDENSDDTFNAFIDIISAEYGLPPAEERFRRRRYRELSRGPAPRLQLYVAYCKGAPAGCHATVVKEDSGHFTGACIVPRFRAYGVLQSLMAVSLKALREMRIPIATGHSNEKSAFWVDRFGFQTIYSYDLYQLDPPAVKG
jgi:Acetyltransferase (GNAT) domain